ncbi:MAG: Rpn family recombination-promoting nuclease/putative transposase [Pirellula sp.]|jgi:hypothetical protein
MSTKIGFRAWVDFAFKKIFGKQGNEICLISLLNSVLDLPCPIESVQYLNPFSMKEFQEDKLICVDVKATDSDGRVFIVEVQLSVTASFVKRALYYASKTYSDQLVEGQGYHDLKATYAVCILTASIWKDNRPRHHFRMAEKGSGEVLRDGIEIQTVEELRELLPGLPFLHATRELREIQEVNKERQMYDSREKGRLDWQSSLLDARAEGRDEGLEKGREEGEIKLIRTLRKILNISYSDDSEFKGKTLVELQAITASLRDQILKRS